MRLSHKGLLTLLAAVAFATLAAAPSGAKIIEIGSATAPGAPSCPSNPCQAVSRTTGYQAKVGAQRQVMAAPADGKISKMSSAPKTMTSHDFRMVSPLSVRDPARPSGLPLPSLSAHLTADLESEPCDHSQVLTRTGSRWDHDGVGTSRTAIRSGGKPEHRADATGPIVGSEPGGAPPTP